MSEGYTLEELDEELGLSEWTLIFEKEP
jgi:DNA-binding CsgD family transcriptional regulator